MPTESTYIPYISSRRRSSRKVPTGRCARQGKSRRVTPTSDAPPSAALPAQPAVFARDVQGSTGADTEWPRGVSAGRFAPTLEHYYLRSGIPTPVWVPNNGLALIVLYSAD